MTSGFALAPTRIRLSPAGEKATVIPDRVEPSVFSWTFSGNHLFRNERDTFSAFCAMIFRRMLIFIAFPSCLFGIILAYDNKTVMLSYFVRTENKDGEQGSFRPYNGERNLQSEDMPQQGGTRIMVFRPKK
jgi:hypothetical protein